MKALALPLSIEKGGMRRVDNLRRSIDAHLAMLIVTPNLSCAADADYGFAFNNFRFNIFNENEGVVYDSKPDITCDYEVNMRNRKLSGKSQNENTFASELNRVVCQYETRLRDVQTSMTYVKSEKQVYVKIEGRIVETDEDYTFNTTIKAWI